MGFIRSSLFISLDGVFEAPDTWHFPYFDDEMGAAVGQLMSETDATLVGRNTYDEFASYWPDADPSDPITEVMNGARKYVVSDSLDEPTWQNTTAISGDRAGSSSPGSSSTPVSARPAAGPWSAGCCEKGLLDELHLLIHPIVVGHGKKLFTEGPTTPLGLVASTTFSTGVVHPVYAPAADSVR